MCAWDYARTQPRHSIHKQTVDARTLLYLDPLLLGLDVRLRVPLQVLDKISERMVRECLALLHDEVFGTRAGKAHLYEIVKSRVWGNRSRASI